MKFEEFKRKYSQVKLSNTLKEEMVSQGFTIREQVIIVIETPYGDYAFDKISGEYKLVDFLLI